MIARACIVAALALSACQSGPKTRTEKDGTIWVSHAFPTGRTSTSAILLERGTPSQVPVGQPYEYTLKLTNLTKHQLEDVVISEHSGAPVDAEKTKPAPASAEAGLVRWVLGTLKPEESRTIRVTATPQSTGELMSRCEVSYRSLLYGITTVYEPKLALSGEGVVESLVGEPVTYKLIVSNPGSGPARDVVVSGELPEGIVTLDGKQVFLYKVAELGAGGAEEYLVRVKGSKTGAFLLNASARAMGDLSAQTEPAPLVVRVATLEVKAYGPAEWVLDREVKYVLTVSNSGDGTARDATLRLALPEGAAYMRSSDETAKEAMWRLGALAPGSERTIEVFVRLSKPGQLSAKATLEARYCETAEAKLETNVIGVPALAIEVSDALDPIGAGSEQTYRIVIRNQGSAAANDIKVLCMLEAAMEFVSASGATKGAAMGDQVLFDPLATLAAGASVEWKVVVRAAKPGDVRFKVAVTSKEMSRSVEVAESTRFFGEK